jgi:small subunit ribosomal protein S21
MSKVPTPFEELESFEYLEVKINHPDDFERALKNWKAAVQKSGVLNDFRAHTYYEKPSDKKRRKKREMIENLRITEMREKQILSGEWDKRRKRREKRREERRRVMQERQQRENTNQDE